jgi:hypothetical protein
MWYFTETWYILTYPLSPKKAEISLLTHEW